MAKQQRTIATETQPAAALPSPDPTAAPSVLTPPQLRRLLAAKAWWQEGERALDYLAERARLQSRLETAGALLAALRDADEPTALHLLPLLPLLRSLAPNSTLSRYRATDGFARSVRDLLRAETPLPERLRAFLGKERGVGAQTISQILFAAEPARYPLVTTATRAVIAPAAAQSARLRREAMARFGGEERPVDAKAVTAADGGVRALLGDFALYETVRATLGVESYADVLEILRHAPQMPQIPPDLPDIGQDGAGAAAPAVFATATNTKRERALHEAATPYGPVPDDGAAGPAAEEDLLRYIDGMVAAQGFTFPSLAVRSYYVALKTKPFVLLAGLSGTGKTRLTELFAEAITGNLAGQYLLLPVRPDWTDGTALLGYQNLLTDRYVSTPFLDKLNTAAQPENRERAFFICLDEMNLARVEHYFADLLSAMETRSRTFPLPGTAGRTATLPANVFLTGTVNVDEATVPLSRKVLDRANVIEFTEVTLAPPAAGPLSPARVALPELSARQRQQAFLTARVVDVRTAVDRLRALDPAFPERALAALTTLNALLEPRGLHFGYRVRDEALRFLANSFAAGSGAGLLIEQDAEANFRAALDLQIVQKALPRIVGTYETLRALLAELIRWAESEALPRTTARLSRMQRRAADDGYVRFYEG